MRGGYRDELSALRARKEALEAEVEALRDQKDELAKKKRQLRVQRKKIEQLEAKVDVLEDELDDAEQPDAEPGDAEQPDAEQPDDRVVSPKPAPPHPGSIAALAVAAIVGGITLLYLSERSTPATSYGPIPELPEPRTSARQRCLLTTIPGGAAVYGDASAFIFNGGDSSKVGFHQERYYLGATPLELSQVTEYVVSVEFAGFGAATVQIPGVDVDNIDAPCDRTVRLTPE